MTYKMTLLPLHRDLGYGKIFQLFIQLLSSLISLLSRYRLKKYYVITQERNLYNKNTIPQSHFDTSCANDDELLEEAHEISQMFEGVLVFLGG